MKKIAHDSVIVAIDIGTTKICVLIAQYLGDGSLEILGIGKMPSLGLARGVVVDIAPAMQSIKSAIKEAELMAGISLQSAYIGISGSHITAYNSTGMITLGHRDVRRSDVNEVLLAARAIALPEGQQILHVLPQYYVIDGHHRIQDPLGMHGMRLEAYVHIITGSVSSVHNLVRCCELAGIQVRDIILEPLASAHAVLTKDEQDLGVALLDIGGGTSDFAIYQQSSIRHTHIFPIAGNLFTTDIAQCLQIPRSEAERVKKEYGCARTEAVQQQIIETLSLDGTSIQTISTTDIAFILEARAHELFVLIRQEIEQHHLSTYIPSGLVLTGGGSLLTDMPELVRSLLHIPVRIGKPHIQSNFKESLDHPMYATGYGLVLYALEHHNHPQALHNGPMMHRIFERMKSWVGDFF